MARRREEEEQDSGFSWYDQPLYDTDEEADPFEDDEREAPPKGRDKDKDTPPRRTGPREVGLIGGCFNVLLIAIVSIIIFLALGVGVVLGGRALGVFSNTASLSAEPAVVQLATATPIPPTEVACEPQRWWDEQQAAFDYFTTLYDRVTIAAPSDTLDAIRAEMTSQRDTAAAVQTSSCLADATDAFTQAVNNAIEAVETFAASGRPSAASQAESASAGLSAALVALWDQGIATDPNTPPNLDISRGGGCDATQLNGWAEPFRQQWQQVDAILSQTDVAAANPTVVQQAVTGLEAVRSNLSAIPAPQCVSRINQLSVIALNSYINGTNATLQGNPEAARESASTYARSRVALNAWLAWLGVEMV